MHKSIKLAVALLFLAVPAGAQEGPLHLTLEECREAAIRSNRELDQSRTAVEMAGYDRKIAFANYFPSISATGAYIHNSRNLDLLPENVDNQLTGLGATAQGTYDQYVSTVQQKLMSDPEVAQAIAQSPEMMAFLEQVRSVDLATPINGYTSTFTGYFELDIENIFVGAVSLQQPLFVGGKIVLSNQMAALAEELALSQYDQKYAEVILGVDQAYWQVVSVASKRRLAEAYADLLHSLEHDVDVAVAEGVSTKSDALQIKVRANEADILLTKATNGLTLAKMLLCKETGLPLDTDIVLADENLDAIPVPTLSGNKNMEDIFASRPETRSLDLAAQIYDKKVGIARSDMMPKVLFTANYLITNPNSFHGFQNTWRGGMVSAGLVVNIPIFHGFEALQKTRKAEAEATLYRDKLEDARSLINLQVTQNRKLYEETLQKLMMTEDSLEAAEENLRAATVGFEAGVVETATVLMAQTGWLQAHSAYLDAGVELQMAAAAIEKAEGNIVPESEK